MYKTLLFWVKVCQVSSVGGWTGKTVSWEKTLDSQGKDAQKQIHLRVENIRLCFSDSVHQPMIQSISRKQSGAKDGPSRWKLLILKSCCGNGRCLLRNTLVSFMHQRGCPQTALEKSQTHAGNLKKEIIGGDWMVVPERNRRCWCYRLSWNTWNNTGLSLNFPNAAQRERAWLALDIGDLAGTGETEILKTAEK